MRLKEEIFLYIVNKIEVFCLHCVWQHILVPNKHYGANCQKVGSIIFLGQIVSTPPKKKDNPRSTCIQSIHRHRFWATKT